MYGRSDIKEGMTVRSIDGEKLGRVFAVQDGEFLIEKGLFFPKDYVCRYSEISDIRDGEIILMHGKEGLHRFSLEEGRGVLAGTGGGAGVGPGAVGLPAMPSTGTGLGADAVAEEQAPTVPVRREGVRVNVERRDVMDRPAMQASFQEETVVVQLRAREGEEQQRPAVAEEPVILKDLVDEEPRGAETVRREEGGLRGDEDVEGSRKLDLTPDDPKLRRS